MQIINIFKSLLCFYIIILSKEDENFDIVIIGAGIAGLTAAYESSKLCDKNCSVALIEKTNKIGGNAIKENDGINILNSSLQQSLLIFDSHNLFYSDSIKYSKNNENNTSSENIQLLLDKSEDLKYFFADEITTVNFSNVQRLNGNSVKRTHFLENLGNFGEFLAESLNEKLKSFNNLKIFLERNVVEIEKTKIKWRIGWKNYSDKQIYNSKNVHNLTSIKIILATGGFGNFNGENSLLKEHAPSKIKFPTSKNKHTDGSGLKLIKKLGGELINMDKIQIYPTAFVDPNNRYNREKYTVPEIIRNEGAILINNSGYRFCNELGIDDYISDEIMKNGTKISNDEIVQYEVFLLMNEEIKSKLNEKFNYYFNLGLIKKYSNFLNFCYSNKISLDIMNHTIHNYNEAKINGVDEFNKIIFPVKFNLNEILYVSVVTPIIHYTVGGVKIDKNGQVLISSSSTISSLYAAGEITGNIHGSRILPGNYLSDCIIFGKISAETAVLSLNMNENVSVDKEVRGYISSGKEGGMTTAAIVGAVISALGILFIFVMMFLLCKNKEQIKDKKETLPSQINNIGISGVYENNN